MKYPYLLLASMCLCFNVRAGSNNNKDSNITISSSKDVYEFVYNKSSNSIQVKEELTINYLCNDYRTSLPVFEFYNGQVQIDDVDFLVDGKKLKGITPAYTYYQIDDYFYSDAHLCYFELPLDKKGSTGSVTFKKTYKDPRYLTNIFFSREYNTASKQIIFKVPAWMDIDLKEMNFNGYAVSKKQDAQNGESIYTYIATNIPAQAGERRCQGPTYIYPHILVISKEAHPQGNSFTYFKTVADQYAWYHHILKDLTNNETIIKAKANEIVSSSKTDMDKVKAIFYWVQNNVRYIAFEDGLAGFLPDKADEVLRKKYGDCKGMANLTKALLKSEGFDARLCWLGTNHIAYDYSTPSLAVDNHMICALMYKGTTYFLDATETYLGLNDYAERIQGRQILIEDNDKYILTKVPAETFAQNLDAEKRILTIKGTDLTGTVNSDWKGEEKENILYQLNNIKKDKSQDAFKKYLADGNADYKIVNLATSDLNNIDSDLTATYDVTHTNAVTSFGKDYYVDLDFKKELNGSIFDSTRQLDFVFPYKTNIQRTTEITVPQGYNVTSVPHGLSVNTKDYDFEISYTQQSNKIIYHKAITLKNTVITKTNFKQWNNDIDKLTDAYNQQLVLTAQ